MALITYSGTAADCTGSSGATDRVLTLTNNGLTESTFFEVFLDGLLLSEDAQYTVSHLTSSSTVTITVEAWDAQELIVNYQQGNPPSSADVSNDFTTGPLNDFGVTVTRTPVVMTTDFSGDKTYTDGTDDTLIVVFENANQKYSLDKSGLDQVFDARMFTKQDATIEKYDKITYNSKVYRVGTLSERRFNGDAMYLSVTLFFINDE